MSIITALIGLVVGWIDFLDYCWHFLFRLYWNIFTLGIFSSARPKTIPPTQTKSADGKKSVQNWILITGCSTGIGRAAALYFSSKRNGNYRVFATVRSSLDEEELLSSASSDDENDENDRGTKISIKPVLMDVTDEKSISRAYKTIKDTLEADGSRLVALINNAGITAPGMLEISRLETLKSVMDVNVFGVLRVTQTFLPLLRGDYYVKNVSSNASSLTNVSKNASLTNASSTNSSSTNSSSLNTSTLMVGPGGSRIINVGSIAGLVSPPGLGLYCASKYALEALSDSLSAELASQNISVSILEPGSIATSIHEKGHSLLMQGLKSLNSIQSKLYLSRIERFSAIILNLAPYISCDTEATNRALEHAICSPYPKQRYLVGLDARILAALKQWLPTAIYDVIVQSA